MTGELRGRPLNPDVPPTAHEFTRELVESGGGSVVAVVLYGSQLHRSSPDRYSAWDLAVVVDRYAPFHRAFKEAGFQRRSPFLLDLLGYLLPPYVTAFAPERVDGRIAKCLVLSLAHLERALRPWSPDHFVKGRFVQHVEVVWTADPGVEDRLAASLEAARRDVLTWAGPFLEEPFDATSLTRRMLQVSFRGEVRPESGGRVLEVWESQEEWMERTFSRVLRESAEAGTLRDDPRGGYRFTDPPGRLRSFRVRFYFLRSKIRGTARWAKHVLTFNDWLTYIKRKAERRTGLSIELTPAERRWPLIFLWPKAIRVLRHGKAEAADQETAT